VTAIWLDLVSSKLAAGALESHLALDGIWGNWQTRPALDREFSRFEAWYPSLAFARGCGSAAAHLT
jgi:hypothetical protein